MTLKFAISVGVIFLVGFLLLFGTHCAYKKIDDAMTLESRVAQNIEEFPEVDHISTSTLAALLESGDVLLIDTREPEEYAVSHLEGAVNLQSAEAIKSAVASRESAPKVVALYCSVGYRSAVLAEETSAAGLANVKNVNGSIFQWVTEGRPVVSDKGETSLVHPFDEFWGKLLPEKNRAPIPK